MKRKYIVLFLLISLTSQSASLTAPLKRGAKIYIQDSHDAKNPAALVVLPGFTVFSITL